MCQGFGGVRTHTGTFCWHPGYEDPNVSNVFPVSSFKGLLDAARPVWALCVLQPPDIHDVVAPMIPRTFHRAFKEDDGIHVLLQKRPVPIGQSTPLTYQFPAHPQNGV